MIRLNRNLKYSRIISKQASAFPWRTFCEQVWPAACFPKHWPRWMGVVLLRSWTWCHPLSHYIKRERLAAQQCECHLFPATYPVIPKWRPQFLFSFLRSETGFCIWDSVFVFTVPLDEAVCTKHSFAATSSMFSAF